MEYNFGLLRQKIKDDYGTIGEFSKVVGIPAQSIGMLLNNKAKWDGDKIYKVADILGLLGQIETYFFTPKV